MTGKFRWRSHYLNLLRRSAACAIFVGFCSLSSQAAPRFPTLHDLQIGYPGATLDLSHDTRWIAAEMNGRLLVLSHPEGNLIAELGEGLLPRWSPVDDRLAFYSTRSGTTQLWIWNRAGGAIQVTHFEAGIDADVTTRFLGVGTDALQYAWSPDGRKLVFASRVATFNEAASKDEPLVLTNSTPPDLTTSGICALPAYCAIRMRLRGRELLMEVAKRGEDLTSQLFLVDSGTSVVTQLTSGDRHLFSPVWTANGAAVLAASVSSVGGAGGVWQTLTQSSASPRGEIVRVDVSTGSFSVVRQTNGTARNLRLSATGDRLAYVASDRPMGRTQLEIMNLADMDDTIAKCSQPVDGLQWMQEGTLEISYREGDENIIANLDASDCTTSRPQSADLLFEAWVASKQGAALWIDGEGTLWRSSRRTRRAQALFHFRSTKLLLGRAASVVWHNSRGEELRGSILYPSHPDFARPYPLIVDAYPLARPHGWTNSMGGNHAWAAAGYAVFMPGERAPHVWMNAADPVFGAKGKGPEGFDLGLDDLLSGIDELIRRGAVDPDRMCLYGHSNGGGAVSYFVTQTNRFKCAVVAAPVGADWVTPAILQTGARKEATQLAGGLDFDRQIHDFVTMSSVFKLYKSTTPMLIVSGDNDIVTDAVGIYNAVRDTGTTVTFVRYPGQGHVLTGNAMEDFWDRQMVFFHKYLRFDSQ